MTRLLTHALIGAGLLACAQAQAAVSVSIGEPGFYGRIDIGGAPPPVLVNPQPVIIAPPPPPRPGVVVVQPQPLYLRVPPGHQKNWGKHCARYNACGQPVYFVTDGWYNDVYAPRYREVHGRGRGPDGYGPPGQRKRDRDDDDDQGHGRGHGRGRD